jgi:hypothetical protein
MLVTLLLSPNPVSASDDRLTELTTWMRAYTDWKEWADKWFGKVEPGLFGPRARRPKPAPPVWLADECRRPDIVDVTFTEACRLFADWQQPHAVAVIEEQIRDQRTRGEAPTNTRWWQHIHVDALWSTLQVPATFGVIGVHATHKIAGRLQVFLAPGAMLLSVPTPNGTREWKPATDLGVSYQLFDFKFPGNQRDATLHLNVAKAWIVGRHSSFIDSSVELAGLSVSFK